MEFCKLVLIFAALDNDSNRERNCNSKESNDCLRFSKYSSNSVNFGPEESVDPTSEAKNPLFSLGVSILRCLI